MKKTSRVGLYVAVRLLCIVTMVISEPTWNLSSIIPSRDSTLDDHSEANTSPGWIQLWKKEGARISKISGF